MKTYYNPLDKNCKFPIGAVSEGVEIKFCLYTDALDARLFVKEDKSGNLLVFNGEKFNDGFKINVSDLKTGLYWYVFEIDGYLYGRNEDLNLVKSDEPNWFQLTVYDNDYNVPNWFYGGIIYQIFPDRFCKSGDNPPLKSGKILRNWGETPYYKPDENGKILNNDFFGGNFKGIESKLEYLSGLGITVIYLNPITKAFSNHRYDVGDYFSVDELLGDESDFISLVDKASEFGIKVILDGVYNHTGDDSVYFNKYGNYPTVGAYQSEKSPYYNWYVFDEFPDKYKCWWDILILPTINKNSDEFENFIAGDNGVIEKFMQLGAYGLRLDVVDELPSRFVKKIREKIKSQNEKSILIGEVWEDATNKIAYDTRKEYFLGKELDSVMNYPLKNALIDFVLNKNAIQLKRVICEQINNYPKIALNALMNLLDTHDTARILTTLGREKKPKNREEMSKSKLTASQLELAKLRLYVCATLQFTLYGVPSLYYGDEVGLQGESDPFNRACFPWGNEDNDILNFYKKLTEIRRTNDVFVDSDVNLQYFDDGVFAFTREGNGYFILVIVNVGEYKFDVSFDNLTTELFSDRTDKKFTIEKFDFKIFKSKEA